MAEDVEGALTVVPVERLVSWIDAGRRRERDAGTDQIRAEDRDPD